jgi:glucose-6-phosphate isomerase
MASISGAAAPPSSAACRLRLRRHLLLRPSHLRLRAPHSIADLSRSSNSAPTPAQPLGSAAEANGSGGRRAVEKDPIKLWERYVEWLYQHKELGLFVDVSRMGFTEEFLQQMEPRMQRAFAAMRELEKGAIANPDEGRMVGHYWLRDPSLAPNSFLRNKIETALDSVLAFSQDIVSGKVAAKFPISICATYLQLFLLQSLDCIACLVCRATLAFFVPSIRKPHFQGDSVTGWNLKLSEKCCQLHIFLSD